jgi:prophage regulatory protein
MSTEHKRFLRLRKAVDRTGVPPSSIYAEMKAGRFPKPYKLSTQRVAWLESDINEWIEAKLAQRDKAA